MKYIQFKKNKLNTVKTKKATAMERWQQKKKSASHSRSKKRNKKITDLNNNIKILQLPKHAAKNLPSHQKKTVREHDAASERQTSP